MSAPATAAPGTTGPTQAQVTQVRAFNRFYTNVIGVLHDMYLDTPHTLTESRLLYEIAKHGTVEVSWLRQALDIDAGYLSRVLSRFESEGLVTRHRSAADARRQEIRATDAGRGAVTELDERAAVQIGALLGGVDRGRLLDAMGVITEVLGPPGQRAVTLRPLAAGDLGWVLQRHGTVYAAEFGWDATFEDFCARIIGEFPALRDSAPGRAEGWIAEVNGVPAGSVFCVPDAATSARARQAVRRPGSACCWWSRGRAGSASAAAGRPLPGLRPPGRLRGHRLAHLRPAVRRPPGLPGRRASPWTASTRRTPSGSG